MAYAGDPTGTNLTSGEATEINNSSPIDQKYKLGERTRNLRGDLDAVGTISSTSLTLNPENGASGTVIVPGNLTVNGATTTVSTTNTVIEDKLVEIATGTTGTPSGDAGLVVERGSSTNAAFVWDESADSWVAATTSATGASTGDLTLTPTDLNVSDIALTPDGISTSHIISSGSLTIRTDANMTIGDSTVDSIKIGRTNTTACRVHLRSGGENDLVVSNGKVGIGVNDPDSGLEVLAGSGNQLKLSFDGTDNAAFAVDTNGDLTITPSGGDVNVAGRLNASLGVEVSGTPIASTLSVTSATADGGSLGTVNVDESSGVRKGIITVDFSGSGKITSAGSTVSISVSNDLVDTDSVVMCNVSGAVLSATAVGIGTDNQFGIAVTNLGGGADYNTDFTINYVIL